MIDFLAVDTSSKYLTVLAKKGERVAVRHIEDCAMRHSVILMENISSVMDELGSSPSDCRFFAAVTGPGSFTGIRIGLSTVKGMSVASGRPCVGVTSFDLIAYNVNSSRNFGVVIDAMRGNYYFKAYDPSLNCVVEPCYLSAEQVKAYGMPLYGFESLPFNDYKKLNAGDCLCTAVLAAAARGEGELHALYVRKSQAEEGRK